MAEKDFPHASIVEGFRLTALLAVPNVIQGLVRRRKNAVALASRIGVDGLAVAFIAGLRRSYGDGPLWIRVGKDQALSGGTRFAMGWSDLPIRSLPIPSRRRARWSAFSPMR